MTDSEISPRTARKSALLVGAVFSAIAAWNVYRGRPWVYGVTGGLGVLLLLTGAASARASIFFHRNWMRFAAALGFINARILLSLMFYLVMTPIGLLGRLVGRNTMQRRGQPKESYWIRRETTRQAAEAFRRSF